MNPPVRLLYWLTPRCKPFCRPRGVGGGGRKYPLPRWQVLAGLGRRTGAIAWAVFAIGGTSAQSADYQWPVMRVIDGDTVVMDSSMDMPPELAVLSVRLRGVDTPEKGGRAKCEAERLAGKTAEAFTKAALARGARVVTRDPEWGKWGGRVIADLIVDGRSLAVSLIVAGHGRPYDGGRRDGWCPAS